MTFQLDAKILFVNGPNSESSSAPKNLRFTKFNAPDPNFQQPQYFLGSTGGAIIVEPDGGILSAGGNGTNSFQFALHALIRMALWTAGSAAEAASRRHFSRALHQASCKRCSFSRTARSSP